MLGPSGTRSRRSPGGGGDRARRPTRPQITFTTNATAAVTDDIEGVAIYDASTSGNLLRVLRSTANLVVAIGSQVIIPAGQLSLGGRGILSRMRRFQISAPT